MISKEEKNRQAEKAWLALHQRLDRDGLLPASNKNESKRKARIATRSAVIVVALSACIVVLFMLLYSSNVSMQTIHNDSSEPALAATLEDGSMVLLGEQTTVNYPKHFAKDKREVSLKGKAFFDISKNAQRPFYIDTEVAKIEVVGTSFAVECSDNSSFLLTVKSGEVKVALRNSNDVVSVKAGYAVYLSSGGLQKVSCTNQDGFKSYLGRVHFKDERLVNIVQFINQHSDSVQINLKQGIENRLLTVTFSDSSPNVMAELICVALNLHLSRQGNIIIISSMD